MKSNYGVKHNGFTLLEILLVLAVVAVLAAALFATLGSAREKMRISGCQSNLKQLGLAIQQYVSDNDGYYPSATAPAQLEIRGMMARGYHNVIAPYIKNTAIFACPSHPNPAPADIVDYGYNTVLLNEYPVRKNTLKGSHETKPLPATTTTLNEDIGWINLNGATNIGSDIPSSCGGGSSLTTHFGGRNVSFLDGHVKWLSNAQYAEQVACPRVAYLNQHPWKN